VVLDLAEVKLTDGEVALVNNVVEALRPVKVFSKQMQATKTATLSAASYRIVAMLNELDAKQTTASTVLRRALKARFRSMFTVDTNSPEPDVHIALRAAALDPSYGDFNYLEDDERDVVWRHVEREALALLVLPALSQDEIEQGFEKDGITTRSGTAAHLRMKACRMSLRMLRYKFEKIAPERRDMGDTDPYEFWRTMNDPSLVQLKPLARAMLTPPASSADSERSFSSAGYIDDPLRGRMSDEGLSLLVLIRDWAQFLGKEGVSQAIREYLEKAQKQQKI
jgi:hypothetical protein